MTVPSEAATLVPAADLTPGELLTSLETTAHELFEVYVLGRKPTLRARLDRRVQIVAGPYQHADALRAGDLLIRGHIGEGHALAAVLADAKLADLAAASELGWTAESSHPGRYAWVVDRHHTRDEHWARRITDRRGFVPPGQAVLRLAGEREPGQRPEPTEDLAEASGSSTPPPPAPGLPGLESRYFAPPGAKDSAVFTREATITPLIDGVPYFAAIKAELDRLTAGDICYLAGWWVDPGFRFAAGGPTLQDILLSKVTAGVDVRVIIWANKQLLDYRAKITSAGYGGFLNVVQSNVRAAESLRAATASGGGTPLTGRVLLDWSGNAASSHHMKMSVFSHEGQFTAFAGEIDFRQDRLDGPPHRHAFPRPDGTTGTWGWHDAGVRLSGRAAGAVYTTFLTRWTEASTLSAATYDIGAGPRLYNPPPLTPIGTRPVPSAPASTDTSVQVVRSFPDSKEFGVIRNTPWTTLPSDGVHETWLTFRTAIAAAQRYIYIEDQAFTATDSLFPALVAACKRGVKVIAVLPGTADPNDGAAGPANQWLNDEVKTSLVGKLTSAEWQNLAVWRLNSITVHSKLMLIDDEFAEIGSANYMDRSMRWTSRGNDSELTACAVSSGSLVRDVRVQLWAEHLQVSDPAALAEIRDLAKSLGFWRPAWGTGITFPHPVQPAGLHRTAVIREDLLSG